MASSSKKEVTLSLVGGDSEDFIVTITDDATPTPAKINLSQAVDGTANRPAIVRFAIKADPDSDDNSEAVVFKTSYFTDQIQVLAQAGLTLGQCRLLLDKPDTVDAEAGDYRWDLEVTRQDVARAGAGGGTMTVTANSVVVTGTGTAFNKAKLGDVLQPLGILNTKPVKITKVVSANSLEVEAAIFEPEAGITFEIRRGKHKTAARGPFTIIQSVVSQ